jgi:hypothetical protein
MYVALWILAVIALLYLAVRFGLAWLIRHYQVRRHRRP